MRLEPGPWYSASGPEKLRLWLRHVLPRELARPWFYAQAWWAWHVATRALVAVDGKDYQTKYLTPPTETEGGQIYGVLVSPVQAAKWRVEAGWFKAGRYYSSTVQATEVEP